MHCRFFFPTYEPAQGPALFGIKKRGVSSSPKLDHALHRTESEPPVLLITVYPPPSKEKILNISHRRRKEEEERSDVPIGV
jgi:hypothetical protein